MPLSERARIEVYLPDLPRPAYQELLDRLDQEFTYAFGGCTTLRDLDGSYLSRVGFKVRDRINLIFTDTRFGLEENRELLSHYAEEVRNAARQALEEEAILVAVLKVYHAD